MTFQEVVRELTMPLFGAKWVYCGECAIDRPAERLRRIGRAGGQRLYQPVNAAYLWGFMDEPGSRMELKVRDPEPHLQEAKSKWWTTTKLKKIRTGFLYEVRKDANHLSRRRLVSEFKMSRFQNQQTNMDNVVDTSLSHVRTTASAHHNGLVKLPEDTLSSELSCWKCGRIMRLGRERLARAVEHVTKFGGRILLTNDDVNVANSTKDFDWRPHQRSYKC
jgi:hypothetical protein